MPAKKPAEEQRVRFNVSCSSDTKKILDRIFANLPYGVSNSEFIMSLIDNAISDEDFSIYDEPFPKRSKVQFQLSCTPDQKQRMDKFCEVFLDSKKRSRWIVKLILKSE